MTAKIKWYLIIFVLAACITMLAGCDTLTEGESGLNDDGGFIEETEIIEESGLNDNGGFIEETEIIEVPEVNEEAEVTENPDVVAQVTGTVKEADVTTGNVIIVSEDGYEIVLVVPSEELLIELAGYSEEGSQITVEYNDADKTVINVIS